MTVYVFILHVTATYFGW